MKQKRMYHIGGGWGNAINWQDGKSGTGKRRVVGWKDPIPTEGDYLQAPMQSGRNGIFRFVKVERCGDPPDMFFATVEDVGYADEFKEETERPVGVMEHFARAMRGIRP